MRMFIAGMDGYLGRSLTAGDEPPAARPAPEYVPFPPPVVRRGRPGGHAAIAAEVGFKMNMTDAWAALSHDQLIEDLDRPGGASVDFQPIHLKTYRPLGDDPPIISVKTIQTTLITRS